MHSIVSGVDSSLQFSCAVLAVQYTLMDSLSLLKCPCIGGGPDAQLPDCCSWLKAQLQVATWSRHWNVSPHKNVLTQRDSFSGCAIFMGENIQRMKMVGKHNFPCKLFAALVSRLTSPIQAVGVSQT